MKRKKPFLIHVTRDSFCFISRKCGTETRNLQSTVYSMEEKRERRKEEGGSNRELYQVETNCDMAHPSIYAQCPVLNTRFSMPSINIFTQKNVDVAYVRIYAWLIIHFPYYSWYLSMLHVPCGCTICKYVVATSVSLSPFPFILILMAVNKHFLIHFCLHFSRIQNPVSSFQSRVYSFQS